MWLGCVLCLEKWVRVGFDRGYGCYVVVMGIVSLSSGLVCMEVGCRGRGGVRYSVW